MSIIQKKIKTFFFCERIIYLYMKIEQTQNLDIMQSAIAKGTADFNNFFKVQFRIEKSLIAHCSVVIKAR